MSKSNDPGHFFQTSSSLETTERKSAKSTNKKGDPIRLPSKITAVISDQTGEEGCERRVFVAESAGSARLVDARANGLSDDEKPSQLVSKATKRIYRGPAAPLTSLAISKDGKTLFGGCWDKCIWSWDVATAETKLKYAGHSDFVKSVICTTLNETHALDSSSSPLQILISGSADSTVVVWSILSGQKLHTIRVGERTSGILDLIIEPPSIRSTTIANALSKEPSEHSKGFRLYAASSDPIIRRWDVSAGGLESVTVNDTWPSSQLRVHETSVNAIVFGFLDHGDGNCDENDSQSGHCLFTASSDNTAKQLVPKYDSQTTKQSNVVKPGASAYSEKATFMHPDFVRAILVLPERGMLVTGCRDEEIRVFDVDNENDVAKAKNGGEYIDKPVHVFSGHYEEVTGLTVLPATVEDKRELLVSVSIDGTIRRWQMDDVGMSYAGGLDENSADEGEEDFKKTAKSAEGSKDGPKLTAEEIAELEELMDSDD